MVWSIKHLESATKTDGKEATNLKKLKIFKHFYIMVICYVYFTRIIGFLLKQVLPFRYEWLDELCTELVTFTFFAMTAYKFQPASNNPYLQVSPSELDEEESLMNEMSGQQQSNNTNSDCLSGNAETVLDLIEHSYTRPQQLQQMPSGPESSNPNLFSRKLNQNSPNL